MKYYVFVGFGFRVPVSPAAQSLGSDHGQRVWRQTAKLPCCLPKLPQLPDLQLMIAQGKSVKLASILLINYIIQARFGSRLTAPQTARTLSEAYYSDAYIYVSVYSVQAAHICASDRLRCLGNIVACSTMSAVAVSVYQ